jgi:hypothetical protein
MRRITATALGLTLALTAVGQYATSAGSSSAGPGAHEEKTP